MARWMELVALEVFLTTCLSLDFVRGGSVKKGVCIGPRNYLCDDLKVLDNIHWWYSWGFNLNNIIQRSGCKNITQYQNSFIPMTWGKKFQKNATVYDDAKFILGFNEPNHAEQANLTPKQAAALWPDVEKLSKGRQLVSPSAAPCGKPDCHGDTIQWFDAFFRLCTGCRIDYIATHAYHCEADVTMDFLHTIYKRYGKKIWLTEFACPITKDPKQELAYMKAILPRLEAASYIYRYAWFVSRTRPATGGFVTEAASLFKQGTSELTPLGEFYNSFNFEEDATIVMLASDAWRDFANFFLALKSWLM